MKNESFRRLFPYAIFISFCLYIIFIELSYFFESGFGKVGVIVWYLFGLLLISYTLHNLIYILRKVVNGQYVLPFLIFLSFTLIGLFYITRPENLSLEATQQISCAESNLISTVDWGFFQNCFLGYPARQFLLPLTTTLIARDIISLNFGNYIYFLLGQILFLSVSIKWLDTKDEKHTGLISLLLILPYHFFYFNYLNLTYEQAFYPIGLGLIFFTSILNLKLKTNLINILIFLLISLLIISSYTTSLAYIPLIFLFGAYFIILNKTSKKDKVVLVLVLITITFSTIVSLSYREDLRFGANEDHVDSDTFKTIVSMILGFNDDVNYVSPVFTLVWLLTLLSALMFKFKFLGLIFLFWSIAVFYSAVNTHGYAGPNFEFSLYRTSIIIPPLIFLLLYYKYNLINRNYTYPFISILFLSALYFQFNYFTTKTGNESEILHDLYIQLDKEIEPDKQKVYLYDLDKEPFYPILNGSVYFLPDLELVFTNDLCTVNIGNSAILADTNIIFEECGEETNLLQNEKELEIEGLSDTLFLYQ